MTKINSDFKRTENEKQKYTEENYVNETTSQINVTEPIKLLNEYEKLHIKDYKVFLELSKQQFDTIWCQTSGLNAVLSDFLILRFVNFGAYGKLFLVQNETTLTYHAMKVMKKLDIIQSRQLDHVRNEKYILQRMNFPFIMHLEFWFKDNSYVYFITPFYSGDELFNIIYKLERLEEYLSRFIAAQVILALEYLHHLDIIYRDLKPENIVFDHKGYIKLTDFGFSKVVKSRTYSLCGTPAYLAPEIVGNKGYGKAVDWWALGVLLFEMNSGSTPFKCNRIRKLFNFRYGTKYKMPIFFSSELQDLIYNILQVDLSRRFGNLKNGVDDIKNHQWFRPILWLALLNRQLESPYIPEIKAMHEIGSSENLDLNVSKTDEFAEQFEYF